MVKKIFSALILSILFISIPEYTFSQSETQSVYWLTSRLPQNLDPKSGVTYVDSLIAGAIYQRLFDINEKGEVVGDLVKYWNVYPEKKQIFLKIKNAHFHNGDKITTDDIIYSLKKYTEEDSLLYAPLVDNIIGLKKINDKELIINLKYFSPNFIKGLATYDAFILKNIDGKFIGSGYYQGKIGKYHIDLIPMQKNLLTFKVITKDYLVNKKLDSKIVDLSVLDQTLSDQVSYNTIITNRLCVMHGYFNEKNIPSDNINLRKSIAQIVQNSLKPYQENKPSYTFINRYLPDEIASADYYNTNRNNFIDENIYPQKLKILISKNSFNDEVINNLKINLKKNGIHPEIIRVKFDEYLKIFKNGNFDITFLTYYATVTDLEAFLLPFISKSSFKLTQYDKTHIIDINEIRKINMLDKFERRNAYEKIIINFEKNMGFIPLFQCGVGFKFKSGFEFPDTKHYLETKLHLIKYKR